jgi:hypothetical protein
VELVPQAAVSPADPCAESDPSGAGGPLLLDELLQLLRSRWQASYDLQLVQRQGRLHLQVMWAYLEQQSFPLDAEAYASKLEALLEVLNGLGVAGQVRLWLRTTREKPRLGKAMGLVLEPATGGRSREFLL